MQYATKKSEDHSFSNRPSPDGISNDALDSLPRMNEGGATTLRVLLVEDEPADAELIALRLMSDQRVAGSLPIQLLRADTAAAACAIVSDSAVDIVILDLSLPDAQGLESLYRVRAASPGTPVVVLTGSADQSFAVGALRAGAQDYLIKPPPVGASVARIIRYACERHRLMQALDVSNRNATAAERKSRLLADIGQALAPSQDAASAVSALASRLIPNVCDSLVVYLAADDEMTVTSELWFVEGDSAPRLRELLAPHGGARTGGAGTSTNWIEVLEPALATVGLAAGTIATLQFAGGDRGIMALANTTTRRNELVDVVFARAVADRMGIALGQYRLLARLNYAIATRDRAVAVVSHDIRSPLSTIQICAAALLDPTPAPPGGVRHMAALIQRSASLIHDIAQDLLDRASLDSGGFTLHRQPTRVDHVMDTVSAVFAGIALEQSVNLVIEQEDDLPLIDADEHRLVQVLSNLVGNAVKFTPPGGHISVSARSEPAPPDLSSSGSSSIRFTVSDTGPGILPEEMGHVFDWFWQSPAGSREGVGIGLAIARGLVEAHRGRLHVESKPGDGCTFWFAIPGLLQFITTVPPTGVPFL